MKDVKENQHIDKKSLFEGLEKLAPVREIQLGEYPPEYEQFKKESAKKRSSAIDPAGERAGS